VPLPAGYSPITIASDRHNANGVAHRNHLVLLQIDGQWCSPTSQAATLQSLIDNSDPLPDLKADLLAQVDAERDRRDDLLLGDTESQLSNLTTAVALLLKTTTTPISAAAVFDSGVFDDAVFEGALSPVSLGQTLTASERAMVGSLGSLYATHLAILAAAQAIATDVNALSVPAAAFAFDVAGDSRWPAVS
jgi:hypothetical protein